MDDATCRECGSTFRQKKGRGGRLAYCSDACRKSSRKAHDTVVRSRRGYKKRLTCATCATPIWKGGSSRPQGEAQCAPCRAAAPKARTRDPRTPCIDCSTPSYGVRCRTCADKAKVNPDATLKRETARRRYARDLAAPGLTGPERRRLRERWIQQRRPCAYCPALATSIDHVVPISLGGTHYEGNLVPCCMDCNARKSDLLLSEWRHGKRLPKWRTEIKLRPRGPARIRRESVPKTCKVFFGTCVECDQAFSSRSARSTRCVDCRLYQRTAERPCTMCGAMMTCKQGVRRYCSTACQRSSPTYKANKKRQRDKWKRTPHGRESMRRAKRKQKAKASQRAPSRVETLF